MAQDSVFLIDDINSLHFYLKLVLSTAGSISITTWQIAHKTDLHPNLPSGNETMKPKIKKMLQDKKLQAKTHVNRKQDELEVI